MRLLVIGVLIAIGWWVVARSPIGLRVGNEVRALSDRAMLDVLRLTSEFEREA